jgi:ATP-dependent Lhr-like helicase
VLKLHYFHRVTQEDFKQLLYHLLETDHIQYTEQGGLIVGLAGERVINSYKFYGVFQESEEYTVRCDSQELGTVCLPPPVGEKLAIAGHVWKVLDLDHKRHLVYVEQVGGRVPAYFGDCPGDLHTKILHRMRQVLLEADSYPYLMKNATARLKKARATAACAGIGQKPLLHLGGKMWCLLPWVGTYGFLTLERFLRIKCADRLKLKHFESARPYFMQFTMDADPRTFYEIVREEIEKPIDPLDLVYPKELPLFDKYDEYLPEALVKKGFAEGVLSLEELRQTVQSWPGGVEI